MVPFMFARRKINFEGSTGISGSLCSKSEMLQEKRYMVQNVLEKITAGH